PESGNFARERGRLRPVETFEARTEGIHEEAHGSPFRVQFIIVHGWSPAAAAGRRKKSYFRAGRKTTRNTMEFPPRKKPSDDPAGVLGVRLAVDDPLRPEPGQVERRVGPRDQFRQVAAHRVALLEAVAAEPRRQVEAGDAGPLADDGVGVEPVLGVQPGPGPHHLETVE